MNITPISFEITYQILEYFESTISELKINKYPSIQDVKVLFHYLNKIIKKSKKYIESLKNDFLKEAQKEEGRKLDFLKTIVNKNYFFFNKLKFMIRILYALQFSNLNFINYDCYEIINYIKKLLSLKNKKFTNKQIFCIISASLNYISFNWASNIFDDLKNFYFDNDPDKKIEFPEFILIRFPFLFKDNFLIKTILFHEFSHEIDKILDISNSLTIDLKPHEEKLDTHDTMYVKFTKILENWKTELIADLISTKIIGPAFRSSLIYWSLFEEYDKSSDTHPSLDFRIKSISDYLKKIDYENSKEENLLLEYLNNFSKKPINHSSNYVYNLAYTIIEENYSKIIEKCDEELPNLPEEDLKNFLKPDNEEQTELLNLIKFNIPIGAFLPLFSSKNIKELIQYKLTSLPKIFNILWKYFFKILVDSNKNIEEKIKEFKNIEARARKSIDIYRGFRLYHDINL